MTTVFEGSPKFSGISGDYARVMVIEDRVLILAVDEMDEESVTIPMTPAQARNQHARQCPRGNGDRP